MSEEALIASWLQFFCGLVMAVLFFGGLSLPNLKRRLDQIFQNMLGAGALMCLTSSLSVALNMHSILSLGLMVTSHVFFYIVLINYSRYVYALIALSRPLNKRWTVIPFALCAAGMLCRAVSAVQASGVAGPAAAQEDLVLLFFAQMLGTAALLVDCAALIRFRKAMRHSQLFILILLPASVFLLSGISHLFTAVRLRYMLISGSLLMMYLFIQVRASREASENEAKLAQYRLALAKSRIHPHFIYNVLTTIYYLCDSDPEKAQEAIELFTNYLRAHLTDSARVDLVPFSAEFSVIREYLSLEQLRYGDRLQVQYDIREEHFDVPALLVEPLVENAVKHGIAPRRAGGTVVLSTRRTEEGVEIRVRDDGAGFDTEAPLDGDRLGLRSVRELVKIVGGSFSVHSRAGGGTEAVIQLPRSAASAGQ